MQNEISTDNNVALRRSIYAILICIGLGAAIGRILAVDSVDMSRLADSKISKELADKRKELRASRRTLSGIRLDYAVLQFRNELAVCTALCGHSLAPTTAAAGVPSARSSSRKCVCPVRRMRSIK